MARFQLVSPNNLESATVSGRVPLVQLNDPDATLSRTESKRLRFRTLSPHYKEIGTRHHAHWLNV